MRINDRKELIKRREDALAHLGQQKKKVYVCGGTGCVAGGSMEIYDELARLIKEKGLECELCLEMDACGGNHDESIGLKKSGCHGFCEMGPVLRIEPAKLFYLKVNVEDCADIVEQSIAADNIVDRLIYSRDDIQ